MHRHEYSVYILTNRSYTTLYTGVTNDIAYRLTQHKTGSGSPFTKKYQTTILVYLDSTDDIRAAIEHEKWIKNLSRENKITLIESRNPSWVDLGETLVDPTPAPGSTLRSE